MRALFQTGHEWYKEMSPFDGILNAHGLSGHYINYYYDYELRPSKIEVCDCNEAIEICTVIGECIPFPVFQ